MSPESLDFLRALSFSAGGSPSDRAAFLTWSLQRIHCSSQRGIAQMIRSCPITRMDSHALPFGGIVPLGLPPPPATLRRAIPRRPPTSTAAQTWPSHAARALPAPLPRVSEAPAAMSPLQALFPDGAPEAEPFDTWAPRSPSPLPETPPPPETPFEDPQHDAHPHPPTHFLERHEGPYS